MKKRNNNSGKCFLNIAAIASSSTSLSFTWEVCQAANEKSTLHVFSSHRPLFISERFLENFRWGEKRASSLTLTLFLPQRSNGAKVHDKSLPYQEETPPSPPFPKPRKGQERAFWKSRVWSIVPLACWFKRSKARAPSLSRKHDLHQGKHPFRGVFFVHWDRRCQRGIVRTFGRHLLICYTLAFSRS